MKKIILVLIFGVVFCGCGVSSEKVCFSDDIEDDCYFFKRGENVYYGIDLGKGEINYDEEKIGGVDLETFKPLNMYFAKDKKNVYGCFSWVVNSTLNANVECKKIKVSDVKNFESIDTGYANNYAKDKENVYYLFFEEFGEKYIKTVKGVDLDTFEVLDDKNLNFHQKTTVYSKDKNYIYFKGDILNNANPKDFRILGRNYLRNKDSCWLREDNKLKLVDMSECEKIENKK